MTDAVIRAGRPWRRHPAGGIPGGVSDLLRTERLVIRDWREDDAEAALAVYGDPAVARWLTPAIETVTGEGPRTADMGGRATTAEVGRAIVDALIG